MNSLPLSHFCFALLVALVWGINFIMVKIGLTAMPPLTLCALRFLLASVPFIFFLPKPKIAWRYLIGYGLLTFAVQFSLLFWGMYLGVSAGISALIIQSQVFFAIFFACLLTQQRLTGWQLMGAIIAFFGIAVIALHRSLDCSLAGFCLLILAAMSWGLGSIITIKFKGLNMISIIVWSSFIAFFPLTMAAFCLEQPLVTLHALPNFSWPVVGSILYITYISTHVGYGLWSWLLSKHPMAVITPFALLCPIVAMIASALFFEESFAAWKVFSALLVILGLSINLFGAKLNRWLSKFWSSNFTLPT